MSKLTNVTLKSGIDVIKPVDTNQAQPQNNGANVISSGDDVVFSPWNNIISDPLDDLILDVIDDSIS